MDRPVTFRLDQEYVNFLELDAKAQFCDRSVILRQIVHKYYFDKGMIQGTPPGKKHAPRATSSDSGPIPEGSGKDRRNVER